MLPRIIYNCICEKCGNEYQIILTESQFKKKKHFFCSKSCANSRQMTEELKDKISKGVQKFLKSNELTFKSKIKQNFQKYYCLDCGNEIKKTKTGYCKKCRYKHISFEARQKLSQGGKNSVKNQKILKRSKNEIEFFELCKKKFKNVINNEPMFNGWDADIILLDLKIAVLWNGKWHYEKIKSNHSVEQIQNRDKIKIKEIKSCNFIPYVIKDLGKENHKKVKMEFEKFIKYVEKTCLQTNK